MPTATTRVLTSGVFLLFCLGGLAFAVTQLAGNNVGRDTAVDSSSATRDDSTWQATAERFARAYIDTAGGHAAWLARLDPYTVGPLHDGFAHTDPTKLPTGPFTGLGRNKPLEADTDTTLTEVHYDQLSIDLVVVKTHAGWRVTDLRPQHDADNPPLDTITD